MLIVNSISSLPSEGLILLIGVVVDSGKTTDLLVVASVNGLFVIGLEVVFSGSGRSGTGSLLPSLVLLTLNSSQAFLDWHLIGFCAGFTSPQSALQFT